ncbi:hypothetical protein BDN72DRAFT_831909 [Pluteus cervinus]|uniref:Uncharacterized protein n=1 Tax=Pluteus cervinus TaxID=181527 RepID=A0ACD3BCP0_9AGAR|nr:hypothetical protein BDN72DRAFT_831909 [Pluteus cervinus]
MHHPRFPRGNKPDILDKLTSPKWLSLGRIRRKELKLKLEIRDRCYVVGVIRHCRAVHENDHEKPKFLTRRIRSVSRAVGFNTSPGQPLTESAYRVGRTRPASLAALSFLLASGFYSPGWGCSRLSLFNIYSSLNTPPRPRLFIWQQDSSYCQPRNVLGNGPWS